MFVAREKELSKLNNLLQLNKSSLVAVYGRRRIGKTETIREFISQSSLKYMETSGVYKESKKNQIKTFLRATRTLYKQHSNVLPVLNEWSDAFNYLEDVLDKESQTQEKIIIFLDELPWLDSHKSGFLESFSKFWNLYCAKRKNIIVIVCGSAATYMLTKIIRNKKTFHARLSLIIKMEQFDLKDTKKLLDSKGCRYSDHSIVDLYIALGGVAKYIEELDCSLRPSQNIQNNCFEADGLLKYEYDDLFESLFDKAVVHKKIMDALSVKWSGHDKKTLAQELTCSSSSLDNPLKDLESSGFITGITKFGSRIRNKLYRATDCFSYFHHRWIKNNSVNNWENEANTSSYSSWSGYAFENICHMHISKIKEILGISGVETRTHYWSAPASNELDGAQIDLLIEYKDGSKNIDIVECKYYHKKYSISKSYSYNLKNKIEAFRGTKDYSKYNIRLIFITTFGVDENEYYNELVQDQITLKDLIQ